MFANDQIKLEAMIENIIDILEKHYYGRNKIEHRCAEELLDLFLVSKPFINNLGNLKSLVSIIENGAGSETIRDTLKESRAIIEKLDNVC
jgi:hypothetical protein